MKIRYLLSAASLVPLAIVIILAAAGIMLNVWVYVILAVVCPIVAGTIWFTYKDVEKKIENAEKEAGRRNKSS